MDLKEVTSPSDLIKMNEVEEIDSLQAAMEMMCNDDINWDKQKIMIQWLISNSLGWHRKTAEGLESDQDSDCLHWADESGKLEAMLIILDSIA